jgi:hypothetical protein
MIDMLMYAKKVFIPEEVFSAKGASPLSREIPLVRFSVVRRVLGLRVYTVTRETGSILVANGAAIHSGWCFNSASFAEAINTFPWMWLLVIVLWSEGNNYQQVSDPILLVPLSMFRTDWKGVADGYSGCWKSCPCGRSGPGPPPAMPRLTPLGFGGDAPPDLVNHRGPPSSSSSSSSSLSSSAVPSSSSVEQMAKDFKLFDSGTLQEGGFV